MRKRRMRSRDRLQGKEFKACVRSCFRPNWRDTPILENAETRILALEATNERQSLDQNRQFARQSLSYVCRKFALPASGRVTLQVIDSNLLSITVNY